MSSEYRYNRLGTLPTPVTGYGGFKQGGKAGPPSMGGGGPMVPPRPPVTPMVGTPNTTTVSPRMGPAPPPMTPTRPGRGRSGRSGYNQAVGPQPASPVGSQPAAMPLPAKIQNPGGQQGSWARGGDGQLQFTPFDPNAGPPAPEPWNPWGGQPAQQPRGEPIGQNMVMDPNNPNAGTFYGPGDPYANSAQIGSMVAPQTGRRTNSGGPARRLRYNQATGG